MKVFIILFLLFSFLAVSATDIYLKEEVRKNVYEGDKITKSELMDTPETWLSDSKIKIKEKKRTMIVDLDKKIFCFINPDKKTYAVTKLPLNLESFLDKKLFASRKDIISSGTVKKLGTVETVKQKKCQKYEVNMWSSANGEKKNPYKIELCASTDFDVSLEPLENLLNSIRLIYNRDENLMKELNKINGIQMKLVITSAGIGKNTKIIQEVKELKAGKIPNSIFEIPKGYKENKQLMVIDVNK